MNKKIKFIYICFCSIIIVFLSVFGIFTLMNNNSKSGLEGRILTKFPDIEMTSLLDDEFYNTYTNAFSDQLVLRNVFVRLYYYLNLQRYVGDTVKGKNGQLYHEPMIIENDEEYIKSLRKVIKEDMNPIAKEVKESGAEFIFISIPRKDVVMPEYLPSSYIRSDKKYFEYMDIIAEEKSDDLILIDAYDVFKERNKTNKKVFYQTDHHLNIHGGYYLFEEIVDIVNKGDKKIEIGSLEDEYVVEKRIVNGSYNRKVGKMIKSKPEDLVLIPKNKDLKYVRFDYGKESEWEIFGTGDTYASAYMGSDFAETYVNSNNDSAPNILYVGSSYTNVLESLSVYKFNRMVSIDYRHNPSGKSIVDYVKEYNIDYVVFICGQSNAALDVDTIKLHLGL